MTIPHGRITGQQVIAAVAEDAGLYVSVLTGQSRIRSVARPRQVAGYLMRRLCPHLSYPAIGRQLGNRDHTTILHGERVIKRLMADDLDLAVMVSRVEARLLADARPAAPSSVTEPGSLAFHALCNGYAAVMRQAA